MMSSAHSTTEAMFLSPLVRLRIARRCLVMAWRESDYLLALTVLGAFFVALIVPIMVILWRAVR